MCAATIAVLLIAATLNTAKICPEVVLIGGGVNFLFPFLIKLKLRSVLF
jgi:hypothetical protein